MLRIENGYIEGNNVYDHRENLKFYRCTWDPEVKKWKAPENTHKIRFYIDGVNKSETDEIYQIWKDACESLGHSFVTKGTAEYDAVKAHMKKMMKEKKRAVPPPVQDAESE